MRAGKNQPKLSNQNFPKFCDLSVKIAPDLKKKQVFVAKILKNWEHFASKFIFFLENGGFV